MEYRWKKIRTGLGILFFLACVALVVIGQKRISYEGTLLMLLGLAGIILCLYVYNRSYR